MASAPTTAAAPSRRCGCFFSLVAVSSASHTPSADRARGPSTAATAAAPIAPEALSADAVSAARACSSIRAAAEARSLSAHPPAIALSALAAARLTLSLGQPRALDSCAGSEAELTCSSSSASSAGLMAGGALAASSAALPLFFRAELNWPATRFGVEAGRTIFTPAVEAEGGAAALLETALALAASSHLARNASSFSSSGDFLRG
mmetsp:Transcript_40445/g.96118  ORF Transcript_40445/g.96118 Transcript_40445/m.96118 type:complete len:206 (+) Transcript_40445:3208-3825(+)